MRLKAYSGAGSSWLGDIQVAVPVLVGLGIDAMSGAASFVSIYAARIAIGWFDLEKVKATDYLMEFLGNKAPARVKRA